MTSKIIFDDEEEEMQQELLLKEKEESLQKEKTLKEEEVKKEVKREAEPSVSKNGESSLKNKIQMALKAGNASHGAASSENKKHKSSNGETKEHKEHHKEKRENKHVEKSETKNDMLKKKRENDDDSDVRRKKKKEESRRYEEERKEKSKKEANIAKVENKESHKPKIRETTTSRPEMSTKETLVRSFLKRWWYAYDIEWYKTEEDIDSILSKNQLRRINLSDWKISDNEVDGKKKCIELDGFPYVFLDCDDKIHDFRNKDKCPSFNNMMKKEKSEIRQLLVSALKKQIEELDSQTEHYSDNYKEIKLHLHRELKRYDK